MNKLVKSGIDLVESLAINFSLSEVFNTSFWQELIITLLVILMNFFVLPNLKKLWNYCIVELTKRKILKVGDKELIENYLKEHNVTLNAMTREEITRLWEEIKKCLK